MSPKKTFQVNLYMKAEDYANLMRLAAEGENIETPHAYCLRLVTDHIHERVSQAALNQKPESKQEQ